MVTLTRLCALLLLMSGYTALSAEAIIITSVDSYTKLIKGRKPVLAMFTAAWCGPCKSTKPHFIELAKTRQDVAFCIIDIDNKDLSSLTANIKGVPTFVGSNLGQEVLKTSGGRPSVAALEKLVSEMTDKIWGKAPESSQDLGKAPESSKSEQAESESTFFDLGFAGYSQLVAVCSKEEFDVDAFQAALVSDEATALFQNLAMQDAASKEHKKSFAQMKSYLRGAQKALKKYVSQKRNLQDGLIRYHMGSVKKGLEAPNYETYVQLHMKIGEEMGRRMKHLAVQVFSEIDPTTL